MSTEVDVAEEMKRFLDGAKLLRQNFSNKIRLLKRCVQTKGVVGRKKEGLVLLLSSCSTGAALCEIGAQPNFFYGEMMMLARSMIEKATNFCYLTICSDKEYERFFAHPYYKMWHNLNKSKKVGNEKISVTFSASDEVLKSPKVARSLELFSKEDSRLNWSEKGIDAKLSVVQSKTKINTKHFLFSNFYIYSDASEALHGSLYGCLFHLGVFDPRSEPLQPGDADLIILKKTALLFAQLQSMVNEVIKYVSEDEVLLAESATLETGTFEEMFKLFGKANN